MNTAIICLGSNTCDKYNKILQAVEQIARCCRVSHSSGTYTFPAINGRDADYANTVIEVDTEANRQQISLIFKDIEKDMGRAPESKKTGIIPIDIDIVIWNGTVIRPIEYTHKYFLHGLELLQSRK